MPESDFLDGGIDQCEQNASKEDSPNRSNGKNLRELPGKSVLRYCECGTVIFLAFGFVSAQSQGFQTCSFAEASPKAKNPRCTPATSFALVAPFWCSTKKGEPFRDRLFL